MKHVFIKRAGLAITGLAGTTALLLHCSAERQPESTMESRKATIFTNVTEYGLQWSVKYSGAALTTSNAGEFTVSAIGPQNSPSACTSGAMMLTHAPGQVMVRSTLSCLASPANCSAPDFDSFPTPLKHGTRPTAARIGLIGTVSAEK